MADHVRPTAKQLAIAAFCLVAALAGAFVAAEATRQDKLFSLSPPQPKSAAPSIVPAPDVTEARRLDLHRTFFTAWAALLLVIPALCLFPFRRSSGAAAGYWLVFWSASFAAFAVHLYWAVVVFFDGDWSRISNTTRVSAPVIDSVFSLWWGIDVLLAWGLASERRIVTGERTVVAALAFALFVAGAAIEGEIWLSKALGFTLAGAVTGSVVLWIARRLRGRTVRPAAVTG